MPKSSALAFVAYFLKLQHLAISLQCTLEALKKVTVFKN
jgi:hypothetical protein